MDLRLIAGGICVILLIVVGLIGWHEYRKAMAIKRYYAHRREVFDKECERILESHKKTKPEEKQ